MSLAPRHRRTLAIWLAALLLLVQLMTAAYACTGGDATARSPDHDAAAMAAMAECDGEGHADMAADLTQLCTLHCEQDTRTANPPPGPDLAAALAAMPLLLWVVPTPAMPPSAQALASAPVTGPPRGAPPLYLSLLSLRN